VARQLERMEPSCYGTVKTPLLLPLHLVVLPFLLPPQIPMLLPLPLQLLLLLPLLPPLVMPLPPLQTRVWQWRAPNDAGWGQWQLLLLRVATTMPAVYR